MIRDFVFTTQSAVCLICLVVVTVLFEHALDSLFVYANSRSNEYYAAVFNSIVREFAVFGIMSFTIFIVDQWHALHIAYGHELHAGHLLLIAVGFTFVLESVYLLKTLSRALKLLDALGVEKFEDICESLRSRRCASTVQQAGELLLMRELFLSIHGLPVDFDFSAYLRRRMCMYVVQTVDVDYRTWVYSISLMLLVFLGSQLLSRWHTLVLFVSCAWLLAAGEVFLLCRSLDVEHDILRVMGVGSSESNAGGDSGGGGGGNGGGGGGGGGSAPHYDLASARTLSFLSSNKRSKADVAEALAHMPAKVRELRACYGVRQTFKNAGTANKAYDTLHAAMQMQESDDKQTSGPSGSTRRMAPKSDSWRGGLNTDAFIGSVAADVETQDSMGRMQQANSSKGMLPPPVLPSARGGHRAGGHLGAVGSALKAKEVFKAAVAVGKAGGAALATVASGGAAVVGMAKSTVQEALALALGKQKLFPAAKQLEAAFGVLLLCNNLYVATWIVNLSMSARESYPCSADTMALMVLLALAPIVGSLVCVRSNLVLTLYKVMSLIYPNFQCIAECVEEAEDTKVTKTLLSIAIYNRFGAKRADVTAEQVREYMRSCFECWDVDGSGTLSRKELRGGLETLGINLSHRRFKLLMREVDANRDNSIEIGEFCMSLAADDQKLDGLLAYVEHMYDDAEEPAANIGSHSSARAKRSSGQPAAAAAAGGEDGGEGGNDEYRQERAGQMAACELAAGVRLSASVGVSYAASQSSSHATQESLSPDLASHDQPAASSDWGVDDDQTQRMFEMQSARSKSAWSARAARDDGGRLPPVSEQRSSTLQVQQQRVLI
jgi:uncharacterized membrane protein YgcG